MAIALVKAGAIVTGTTSVAPSFGQATTAGNLLVAQVTAAGTSSTTTVSGTGWVIPPKFTSVGFSGPTIAYKPNCGAGESPPTFSASGATHMAAVLSEWSGADTTSPLDQDGATTSNTITNGAPDTNSSDVYIVAMNIIGSKTATATFSDSFQPTGGTAGTNGNTGATSGTVWDTFPYYFLNGHGGGIADDDSVTVTLSKGVVTNATSVSVSFLPPAAPQIPQYLETRAYLQATNRASTF